MRVSDPFTTAPVRARSIRRGIPIHAYIGGNGGGKSLAAIFDTLPTLAAGRPVVSTVRILDPATGEPHPLWVPLDSYKTIVEVENCDVILDEVNGVASSRESASMPAAIERKLVQLRRSDVTVRWTAPSWKRADTVIRECSQGVTLCMGFLGVPQRADADVYPGPHYLVEWAEAFAPDPANLWCPIEGEHTHDQDRMWSSKRLFYWRTFDAQTFDEWSFGKKEKLRPMARQLFWRPGSIASAAYDTFDAVLSLGTVTDSGACMDCGGNRRRPACSCAGAPSAPARPRRSRGVITISETDDTPAVAVDLDSLPSPASVPVG